MVTGYENSSFYYSSHIPTIGIFTSLKYDKRVSLKLLYFLGNWSALWKADCQDEPDREPHLCALLSSVLWKLTGCRSQTTGPPGILSYGLRHAEHTLHALADTIHAFQLHGDSDCVSIWRFIHFVYLLLLYK